MSTSWRLVCLFQFFLFLPDVNGHASESTSASIASARIGLIGIAAYYYQEDNGSAPESFRNLTYPRDYLLPIASNLYSTIWNDPFAISGEPLIIRTKPHDPPQNQFGFNMPYPGIWEIISRGPDKYSDLCRPETLQDDLKTTYEIIESHIHDGSPATWGHSHWKVLAKTDFTTSTYILKALYEMPPPPKDGDFYSSLGAAISGRRIGDFYPPAKEGAIGEK